MQVTNYDKQAVVNLLRNKAVNNSKLKGKKPTTPKDDNIKTDIKSMSITNDVDGAVFNVSFHEMPTRFYSFALPESMYEMFEHFKRNYAYTKTPRKAVLSEDDFSCLFAPKKSMKDLLGEVNN